MVTYPSEVLTQIPVYHLISLESDIQRCHYTGPTDGVYRYYGTFVYNGDVYDHVRYRIKGRASTRRTGKNNTSAFNSSEIQFQIDGSDLLLDKIVLSGDAITLKGIGRVGYNRDVDLSFYSIVGQERFLTPVLRPIIGEASRQFLEIKVGGTLDEPTTRQDVLPGVSETIGRFFPEQSTQARQRNPKRRFSVRNLKLR